MSTLSWSVLRRVVSVLTAITAALLMAQITGLSDSAVATADASTGSGGEFIPLQGRILDTRAAQQIGAYSTPMPANTWRTVQVTGQAGIPSSGVAAIAVNFTAINNADDGYLKADKDEATPDNTVSYMFWVGGQPQTNSGVVAVASDGKIQVKATSSTDLLIDVQGYYTAGSPAAGGFVPVPESRIVDTRNGTGLPDAQLQDGSTSTIQVSGLANVPSDASAVMLNFLVENQSGRGNLVAYPADSSVPDQYLHFGSTQDATTAAIALSATSAPYGAIKAEVSLASGGGLDLVVDVLGYFTAEDTGGSFTPAAARVYDSRTAGNSPLAAGASRTIQVAGVSGVPSSGLGAVAMDVDIFDQTGISGGWTHLWPDDGIEPNPSMAVQYAPSGSSSNLVTVGLGADGGIEIRNRGSDSIDFAIDVEGWYTPAVAPAVPPITIDSDGWIHYNDTLTQNLGGQGGTTTLVSGTMESDGSCDDNGELPDSVSESSNDQLTEEIAFNPQTCDEQLLTTTLSTSEQSALDQSDAQAESQSSAVSDSAGLDSANETSGADVAAAAARYTHHTHVKTYWIDRAHITITDLNQTLAWNSQTGTGGPAWSSTATGYHFDWDGWQPAGASFHDHNWGTNWVSIGSKETFTNSDFAKFIAATLGPVGWAACGFPTTFTATFKHSLQIKGYSGGAWHVWWNDHKSGACADLVHHAERDPTNS